MKRLLVAMAMLAAVLSACGRSATPAVASCIKDSAPMTAADLGSFTQFESSSLDAPPFKGLVDPSNPPDFMVDFVAGEERGFIANLALAGPFRTEEDARASALGYGPGGPGGWPLVPLQGRVVLENPGLLEVYEVVEQYSTASAASSWFRLVTGNFAPATSDFQLTGGTGISEARTVDYVLGDNDGQNEHVRRFFIRAGAVYIDVSLQSGADLQLGAAIKLSLPSISRIVSTCGSQT